MKRQSALRGFDLGLLIISLSVLALFSFMVWQAHLHNLWPAGPWGLNEGNHGPWHGTLLGLLGAHKAPEYVLQRTLLWLFSLQAIVVLISGMSLLYRGREKRFTLLSLNFLYLLVLFGRYYWLID